MKVVVWLFYWFFYFPLLKILVFLFYWHPKLRERLEFERRNDLDFVCRSFSQSGERADLCFEFSSEGEYQQAAPLIEDALVHGKKIELVFFSPSVEKTVLKLASQYPDHIRCLRFPLLSCVPWVKTRFFDHWITSKNLILIRYDLFPELLLWSFKKDRYLKIIWVTFKKERSLGKNPSFWKIQFLKQAKELIFASPEDLNQGKNLGFKGDVFDFRLEQIKRRVEKKEEKFFHHFSLYPEFKKWLNSNPKTVILGNAWPSDLFLLEKVPEDYLVVLVPHHLSDEILLAFKETLKTLGRIPFEVSEGTEKMIESKTVLLNRKGILCELYQDFDYAYVGGGFESSIHSVLEPLVAGSRQISCGPLHFRSTEFDIAKKAGRMTEVKNADEFRKWLMHPKDVEDRHKIDLLFYQYQKMRESVISC
jgi:3-deoxy-D-manno-octulosonic-acid transferase